MLFRQRKEMTCLPSIHLLYLFSMHMNIQLNVKYRNFSCSLIAYTDYMCIQVSRNPRNIPGYALSDGEVVERLWSYLRRFSTMTKEMRPAHRIDVLTHALLHYGRYACENIGLFLKYNYILLKSFVYTTRLSTM